eukprot:1476643-Pleurochrysis_carterae.AAC.3
MDSSNSSACALIPCSLSEHFRLRGCGVLTCGDQAGGYEYHKRRVAEAVAGRGVVSPLGLASLEGAYMPGCWLFRVLPAEGVQLHTRPSAEAPRCGELLGGEYVRGVEL